MFYVCLMAGTVAAQNVGTEQSKYKVTDQAPKKIRRAQDEASVIAPATCGIST